VNIWHSDGQFAEYHSKEICALRRVLRERVFRKKTKDKKDPS